MAKKQKDEIPNVNAIPNRDVVQRLNFLYQASVYLQSLPQTSDEHSVRGRSADDMVVEEKEPVIKDQKRRKCQRKTTSDLARTYIQTMKVVGQKATIKLDPSIKRSICSHCDTALIVGSSANLRVKKSSAHRHLLVYTCLHCDSRKTIPAPPLPAPSQGDGTTAILTEKHKLPLPLAARRAAGHIVFRGNSQLDDQHGPGTCFI
ncbi:RNAse P Rpr2/Rpp21/SNM1 subunit domain-containing protein [Panaeolus papilionaceus]|nr:RNAse P Rpr2/Rpp21/SNM1 subunit domain-containing protein [Panaeolus papilionaceus]